MTTPRKHYSADFKAKVALEAIKGQKTLNELDALHAVHPNQIMNWKKQVLDEIPAIFSNAEHMISRVKKNYRPDFISKSAS